VAFSIIMHIRTALNITMLYRAALRRRIFSIMILNESSMH
jgi:hypothetical protein